MNENNNNHIFLIFEEADKLFRQTVHLPSIMAMVIEFNDRQFVRPKWNNQRGA